MGWLQSTSVEIAKSSGEISFQASSQVSSELQLRADADGLHCRMGAIEKSWSSDEVTALRSVKVSGAYPPLWKMELKSASGGWIDVLDSYDENSLLTMMEGISVQLHVPFKEHTGRLVRRDEHGMGVVEQLGRFPDRWPRPQRLPSISLTFRHGPGSVQASLPTQCESSPLIAFWTSIALSAALGLVILYLSTVGEIFDYAQLLWPVMTTTVMLVFWMVFNSRSGELESSHRLRLSATTISIQPKFVGIVPLRAKIWAMDEFMDIDSDEQGRLSLVVAGRRYTMRMQRREAEWFVGEIATQIEQLMVDRIDAVRKEQKLELSEAFKQFDTNNDGTLSSTELETAIEEFGIGLSKNQMIVLMQDMDKDSDGQIDYQEFVNRFTDRGTGAEEEE